MTKRIAVLLCALGCFAVGVAASDFFTPMFSTPIDYEVAIKPPCGPGELVKSATPIVFDGTLMVHYLCTNPGIIDVPGGQTEHWRRYLRPLFGDGSTPPATPVYLTQTAAPTSSPICPAGFVHTKDGQGCVPPNHPLAGPQ